MAERISAKALDDWRQFEESFGPITIQERLDLLFAATLARGSGKPVKDFLPKWGGETDDIVGRLSAMAKPEEVKRGDNDR